MQQKPDPKPHPEHIRQDFYRLTLDWVYLYIHLPKPTATDKGRKAPNRAYGHPAEWASDRKRDIVELLTNWHAALAQSRNEAPPPAAPAAELVRVVKAWRYIEPRIEHLIALIDNASELKPITDIHHRIRASLGFEGQPKQALLIPCPNCELKTLSRTIAAGNDIIQCEACGLIINANEYPKLVEKALDNLTKTSP